MLLYVGKKLNEWGFVKSLMQKHNKWVQNSLPHETLVLLRQENLLSRKHIKSAMYLLIVWENFSTKLFRLLRQEHFLRRDTIQRFDCTFIKNTL